MLDFFIVLEYYRYMKKIDFKFSKRQVALSIAFLALLGFTSWSAGALSPKAPETSGASSQRVSEHISVDEPEAKTVSPENIAQTAPQLSEQTVEQPKTEEPAPVVQTIYEKYGVSQSTVSQFESYYPTYAAHNQELFVSTVAKVASSVDENNVSQFLDSHAQVTGIKGRSSHSFEAEKNSFLRLVLNSGQSWQPWSTL